jgi:hypothetical protein
MWGREFVLMLLDVKLKCGNNTKYDIAGKICAESYTSKGYSV